jgi:hypothetical protein
MADLDALNDAAAVLAQDLARGEPSAEGLQQYIKLTHALRSMKPRLQALLGDDLEGTRFALILDQAEARAAAVLDTVPIGGHA